MMKFRVLILLSAVLLIIASGCIGGEMELPMIDGKKVLLIIAENFRDEEYFQIKQILEAQGALTTTTSSKSGEISGMLGGKAKADMVLDQVNVDQYDAVVFIGGSGAQVYFDDSKALSIAKEAYDKGKIVTAICIAPVILANAGILEGKKTTVWNGEFVTKLEAKGASYTDEQVTRDGRIITGNGPQASTQFAGEIVKTLAE